MITDKYLYRYENHRRSNGVGEFEESLGSHLEVRCCRYKILTETPKGFWISYPSNINSKRLVMKKCLRKFACIDKETAAESFTARKNKQIKILKHQIKDAECALSIITNIQNKERKLLCPQTKQKSKSKQSLSATAA